MRTQQHDLDVLRICLGGTLRALQAMADGDRYGAMQSMMRVDAACRDAHRLLSAQRAAD